MSRPDRQFIQLGTRHQHLVGEVSFGIHLHDLMRHLWVIGRSGQGKTVLLHNLAVQLFAMGSGVLVIDPHGDLYRHLLKALPRERVMRGDVALLDMTDTEHPVGINLLSGGLPPDQRPKAGDRIASLFRSLWGISQAQTPRLELLLANVVGALLEAPKEMGISAIAIPRFLADPDFADAVLVHCRRESVRRFWFDIFLKQWNERYRAEGVAALYNLAGHLDGNPFVRNVLGQHNARFDMRAALDRGQIVLVNVSTGELGESASNLLGGVVLTALELAAFERQAMLAEERAPFPVVVDEFTRFTTDVFATTAEELRKFSVGGVYAHQHLQQADDDTRGALHGAVDGVIAFRVGSPDARAMATELAPFPAETLVSLDRGQVVGRLSEGMATGEVFIGQTLPPLAPGPGAGTPEAVRACSRRHFARPRAQVEATIESWSRRKVWR